MSFFAPQSLPGGPPNSFTIHNSVRPPHQHGPPHSPPPFSPPIDNSVRAAQRPWPPHYPPRYSPPGPPAATANSYGSPPPAYSPALRSTGKRDLLDPEDQSFDGRDEGLNDPPDEPDEVGDRLTTALIVFLVVLNVLVWGAVAWNVVHQAQAPRLWQELQQSDRVMFDV